jgi:hypothetical protein
MNYIVICRTDSDSDGTPGKYVLATRQTFRTEQSADAYAAGISPSRSPIVVEGDFDRLRQPIA